VPGVVSGQDSAAIYSDTFVPKPAYRALQVDLALATRRHHG